MPTSEGARITVVVVTFNSSDEIQQCVESIRASSVPVSCIVVDNASADGTVGVVRQLADVDLVANTDNAGFGAGCNEGAACSTTEYLFFLNPDAALDERALERLLAFLDRTPSAGVVGPLVLNPDGSVQASRRSFPTPGLMAVHGFLGMVWPTNPFTARYLRSDIGRDRPSQVDWVAANSLLVRREAFNAVGGFDESFFFFMEDVDLCKRLHDAGWQIWFEPSASVTHAWGASWTARPIHFIFLHHTHMWRFMRKHYRGTWQWPLLAPVVAMGLAVRFAVMATRVVITKRVLPAHASAGSGARTRN